MTNPVAALPYLTADLPGVGGVLRQSDEDFRVDERLPYAPTGTGDHVFVRIEKRGLSTPRAAELIARALDVNPRDVGWAGMKDRHAVTRQTLSLPPPCTPEAANALELPGISVLTAVRHRHKLRTGHVAANHFTLCIRELAVEEDSAAERVQAVLDALAQAPGSPNFFGAQRFGRDGDNADVGRALVTGTPLPRGMRKPRGRKLRLFVSALQSQLFNEYLAERMNTGWYRRVLPGDILQKRASGGSFACEHPETEQARVDAGELVPTGPMFGHKFMRPATDTESRAREDALLQSHGLTCEDFDRVGKLGIGTRRPLAVTLSDARVTTSGARTIELCFGLPAGAYATAVVREVVKGSDPFPG